MTQQKLFQEKDNNITVNVYIVSRSLRSEVVGIHNNSLKIKLNAMPVNNEANKELIRFLADKLKLAKSNIKIVSGLKQKKKVVLFEGCNSSKILNLLK